MAFIVGEEITGLAVKSSSTAHSPGIAVAMIALSRQVHELAREVDLTEDVWMAASSIGDSLEAPYLHADYDLVPQKR